MDLITLAIANQNAKSYTDDVIEGFGKGIQYKGAVNYYNNLPNNAELGDCYSVLYKGSSGTTPSGAEYVWGQKVSSGNSEWIQLGEDIDMSNYYTKTETNNAIASAQEVFYVDTGSSSEPFVFDGKKKGIYIRDANYNDYDFYYKSKSSDASAKSKRIQVQHIVLFKDIIYDELETGEVFGYAVVMEGGSSGVYSPNGCVRYNLSKDSLNKIFNGGASIFKTLSAQEQSIFGIKTFYSIPVLYNGLTPTTDMELVNKKYVDDTIGTINTTLGGI